MFKRGLFIVLLGFILFVIPASFYSAVDKDEPKYLEAAREMLSSKDFIVPTFNCSPRFDKPILTYWLVVAGYKVLGVGEFGGRFFVCIFGVFTALLIYWWLKSRDEKWAWWTSLSLVATLEFALMASISMPDIILLFFITSALIALFEGKYLWAAVLMAFATLAKGPVGFVLPFTVILVYWFFKREIRDKVSHFPWGIFILTYLAVAAPWFVAVTLKTRGEFLKVFLLVHNVERFTKGVSGHSTQWWYYPVNGLWMYLPITPFIPVSVFKAVRRREDPPSFFAVWFVVVFLFFQLARTKLPHYLLPSIPAACSLAGYYYRDSQVFKRVVLGFLVLLILFKWTVVPVGERFRVKPKIAALVKEASKRGCGVIFYRYFSAEVVYKSGMCIRRVDGESIKRLYESEECLYVITKCGKLRRLGLPYKRLFKATTLLDRTCVEVDRFIIYQK